MYSFYLFFFFKQKTAYEMRISDWSSDVCSSDLFDHLSGNVKVVFIFGNGLAICLQGTVHHDAGKTQVDGALANGGRLAVILVHDHGNVGVGFYGSLDQILQEVFAGILAGAGRCLHDRSEEHTSELQSLMRISYAVFC